LRISRFVRRYGRYRGVCQDHLFRRTKSISQTFPAAEQQHGTVTVRVNNKPVILTKHRVTGLEIKQAAIAQHVDIELDFILTVEARDGQPAETIDDDRTITVTEHSEFSANDGDDDS
jgi:Multiubiquitin